MGQEPIPAGILKIFSQLAHRFFQELLNGFFSAADTLSGASFGMPFGKFGEAGVRVGAA